MLSRSFLEPYELRGDNFPNLLARSTFLSKYSRDGESWTSTIARVVNGNCAGITTDEEAEKLFDVMWHGEGLPPGRGLYTGGVAGMPVMSRYNCFSPSTRMWADGKLRRLDELVGQVVSVIGIDGTTLSARVQSFGIQRLQKVVLGHRNSNIRFEFECTNDHTWHTSNRGKVTDLRVGDKIKVMPKRYERDEEFLKGFVHGIVFGDGCATTGREDDYQVRLCGDKARYTAEAVASEWYVSHSYPASYGGDPHVRLRSPRVGLKELPSDDTSLNYQAGFLAGWLSMDGYDTRNGARVLTSIHAEHLDWVTERSGVIGYCAVGRSVDSSTETNYGKRSAPVGSLRLTRDCVEYKVREITEGLESEVFCAVEPTTNTFTLAGGIPTGNCAAVAIRTTDDWRWTAYMLMCGSGVGLSLAEIDGLPYVVDNAARFFVVCSRSHPDRGDVDPDEVVGRYDQELLVEDSREGWADAFKFVLDAAFAGRSVLVNVSALRPYGSVLRTFGGHASGPGALVTLLRNAWSIIRHRKGGRLTSVDCLDITNWTGIAIRAGGARRSALIVLGRADDTAFRRAKHDFDAVRSHRSTSNNSIVFETEDQIDGFDWTGLVEDMTGYGEPGVVNLWKMRQTDPDVVGVNPCGEIPLENRELCCLSEVYPAKFRHHSSEVLKLITRYTLRQRLAAVPDAEGDEVRRRNMRIGVSLCGITDFDCTPAKMQRWYRTVRLEADCYADELGVSRPNMVTTVKPDGTVGLLSGSSPGIHASHAPFYVRRTRISEVEPMAQALTEAGVPHVVCPNDTSGRTLVFEFPMAAEASAYATTETVRDQVERLVAVQTYWADNAVSMTVNFNEDEKPELASLLEKHIKSLKSVSCLPRAHGYDLPPYEAIDETEYAARSAAIDHTHPLTAGGALDIDECRALGYCPT